MARPYVRSIKPRDAKEVFGNLSQTKHYQVSFGALPTSVEAHIYNKFSVYDANNFMSRKGGLLCSDASLPGSNLATGDVKDNFMGVPQEFAHTRLYADIDFTFYVDRDYTNLRIFEGWIDYISSGSGANELSDNYFRRMRYPETYKANTMYISKFEKDYGNRVDYLFVNAFPKLVNAIPVSYGGADILKVSVSFNYDRYIMNPDGKVKAGKQDTFKDIEERTSGDVVPIVSIPDTGSNFKPLGDFSVSYPNEKEPNPVPAGSTREVAPPTAEAARQARLAAETQGIVDSGIAPKGGYTISKPRTSKEPPTSTPKTKHFGQALHDFIFRK